MLCRNLMPVLGLSLIVASIAVAQDTPPEVPSTLR